MRHVLSCSPLRVHAIILHQTNVILIAPLNAVRYLGLLFVSVIDPTVVVVIDYRIVVG